MDYSAVVSALVRTHPRFLFKNHHPLTGKSTRNLPSHRQSHHAAANDNDVTLRAHLHFLVAQHTGPRTRQPFRISVKQGTSARTRRTENRVGADASSARPPPWIKSPEAIRYLSRFLRNLCGFLGDLSG